LTRLRKHGFFERQVQERDLGGEGLELGSLWTRTASWSLAMAAMIAAAKDRR